MPHSMAGRSSKDATMASGDGFCTQVGDDERVPSGTSSEPETNSEWKRSINALSKGGCCLLQAKAQCVPSQNVEGSWGGGRAYLLPSLS